MSTTLAAQSGVAAPKRRAPAKRRRKALPWTRLSDAELLNLRFCDLKLTVEGSSLRRRISRLYVELEERGIHFRPHVWLSEEWFSPDGVPGIAVPFYLAHPRLEQLEHNRLRLPGKGGIESVSEAAARIQYDGRLAGGAGRLGGLVNCLAAAREEK